MDTRQQKLEIQSSGVYIDDMRLDEIEVYVAVLEAGSFVGAARKLRMPASTVSARVAALEARLGTTLIVRTTRKLRPTDAGQQYFSDCKAALQQVAAAEKRLVSSAAGVTGLLRMTASVDVSQGILPPIIARFREAYPSVEVELIVTDRVADLLAEGIDLAVRVGPLVDSSLTTRVFIKGPTGLFASLDYLKRRGVPKRLEDLASHDFIGFGKIPGGLLRLMQGNEMVEVRSRGAITCDDFLATRAFISLGLGIGFLPAFLASERSPPLVRILPQLAHQLSGLYFAYPAQPFVPQRVKRFVAFASEAPQTG